MSVARSNPTRPLPEGCSFGLGWAYSASAKKLGVLVRWADGGELFHEGPDVEPPDDVSRWCVGVVGLFVVRGDVPESDAAALIDIACGFYKPLGLWGSRE